MVATEMTHRDSFVVRTWRESGGSGWKGWVQHTGSGEAIFFERWNELLAFLERWVAVADTPIQTGLR